MQKCTFRWQYVLLTKQKKVINLSHKSKLRCLLSWLIYYCILESLGTFETTQAKWYIKTVVYNFCRCILYLKLMSYCRVFAFLFYWLLQTIIMSFIQTANAYFLLTFACHVLIPWVWYRLIFLWEMKISKICMDFH